MMKFTIILIIVVSILTIVLLGGQEERTNYEEINCASKDSDYVFLETSNGRHIAGFIFTKKGITFKGGWIDYAKPYTQITSIEFNESNGYLIINMKSADENHINKAGTISKRCWLSIKEIVEPYTRVK